MTDEQKRGRGRPATYSSDAERARAWRERQKELIAQAQAVIAAPAAAPVAEPPVPKPVRRRKEKAAPKAVVPNATALGAVLREQMKVNKDAAKAMRTKAAQTATFIKDLKERAKGRWNSEGLPWDAPEHEFLKQAEIFFLRLNAELEVAQRHAKRDEEERLRKWEEQRAQKLKELAVKVLGPAPVAADVLAMAADLDAFDGKAGREWLARRYEVSGGHVSMNLDSVSRRGLYSKDAKLAARAIAEAYESLSEESVGKLQRGFDKELYVSGCWNDFLAWRAERATKAG